MPLGCPYPRLKSNSVVALCKLISESRIFERFITFVIIAAGVVVGLETYPGFTARHHALLHFLDTLILGIFIAEIFIKTVAQGRRPWRYFYDSWNIFDFVIVAGALLPFTASYATVLRLLRLLRVLRLLRALPKLQVLVGTLLRAIPSMGYVSLLLFLLFYVYAVAGVFIWGANDPVHFEDLEIAFVSLFRVVTLEDWTDIMYINMYGCADYGYQSFQHLCTQSQASPVGGAIFFISFVLLGTMIMLNLFIGVILSGMEDAKLEAADDKTNPASEGLQSQLQTIQDKLGELQAHLASVQRAAAKTD